MLCFGRFVRQAGDMPLEEWLAKEEDGTIQSGDYVVTAILDERRRPRGCIDEFIVKWKASSSDVLRLRKLAQIKSLMHDNYFLTPSSL